MASGKKRILWIVVILTVVVGGYFLLRPKAPVTVYTTVAVSRGDLKQTVSETGTIKTVNQTDLSFKVSGRVVSLLADVGDKISEGQLLARLDLGTLGSELAQARQDVKYQHETLDSMKDKKATFNTEDRNAQRARLKSAEESIASIQSRIRDTFMYSPINGTILKRNVDPYETTVANSPTPVFTVGDASNLEIVVNIPESDITKIKLDQNAEVTFDALPVDQIFMAKVTKIDPDSTVIQDVVNYRVKLKLDQNSDQIKPGMTANIDIHTAEIGNILMIPVRAVQTEGKEKFVQVLVNEKTNQIERRKIEMGLEGDEGMVEVKSGLKVGEKVVTFTGTK
ncbi:efflux RND transporter periplasmic adaptor subunit [Patescibacteria group bacterium]|nr:MAG: efflux RND transporter periplasmic adaptor subunit [Patescibacteria group bacterium]